MRSVSTFGLKTRQTPTFSLSLNGVPLGAAAQVWAEGRDGSGPHKSLLGHELTHVVQAAGTGPVTLRLSRLSPEGAGTTTLLRAAKGRKRRITTGDKGGIEGRIRAAEAKPQQQEWSIVYETIQRVY